MLRRLGHQALAVAGDEPGLSQTVAAAVRAYWQETAAGARRQPVWWTAPARLRAGWVPRALADHLGSPVARGHNPSVWVRNLLADQAVPVLVLSGLGQLPVGRSGTTALPRQLVYLVRHY